MTLMDRNIGPAAASYPVENRPLVGQAADYADLYSQYLPRILNYVRLRVGDEDLAQDLTAAVFERAVSRQQTLRRREAFGAWLFRIAQTTIAGHYRRHRPTVSLEQVAVRAAADPSPPEAVMHREELARLHAALAVLSRREQEIIRLKFGGELGNQEIGQVLRLKPTHVAVLIYRALRKLRANLESERLVAQENEK
jgi:RNA polymerase sigma-70 factor (ECF subfamily)